MARRQPIMVLGCTSDAGKSFLAAALCRWLAKRGESVAPFKAQNMSNNAAVCPDGSEIGRAQFLQARAARAVPDARMNPVLLKPEADTRSQVVVMGRYDPALSATPWLERREKLWPLISAACDSLAAGCGRLVIEGAGSPAEPNLMPYDLVNLAVARHAGAACYLVADIDRGGAFAHLLGTWQTLEPADRALIRGFVLNKFRGDPALLLDAREWLRERTGVPVVALVPWQSHVLPEEDAFFHRDRRRPGRVRIALVMYPRAANLDEFDPLAHEDGVELVPAGTPADLEDVQAIILPGSKHSAASLDWLRATGCAAVISRRAREGLPVFGVCGGLQILGRGIADPEGLEGGPGAGAPPAVRPPLAGLGLLPLDTTFQADKITRQAIVASAEYGELAGYEIHLGRTRAAPGAEAFLPDGLGWRQGNVSGVYLHGIFGNGRFRRAFLATLGLESAGTDWDPRVEDELERIAGLIDRSGWAADLAALDAGLPPVACGGRPGGISGVSP
jgi:adenosylcobyric acid synthase